MIAGLVVLTSCTGRGDLPGAQQTVTFADYERAVVRTIQCVREEAGVEVNGPLVASAENGVSIVPGYDPRDYLSWTWVVPEDPEEEARVSLIADRCQERYQTPIEEKWLAQRAPTQEEVEAWYERAEACVRSQGEDFAQDPEEQEILDALSEHIETCWTALFNEGG